MSVHVLYCSYQPYSLGVAEIMQRRHGWEPVYWMTGPAIEDRVRRQFPGAVRHNFMDAVKGRRAPGLEDLKTEPIEPALLERLAVNESIALTMMERNDALGRSFQHLDRVAFYHDCIRYLRAILKSLRVQVVVFEEEPHQVSDYVLYLMAGELGIETFVPIRTVARMGFLITRRFEEGVQALQAEYRKRLQAWDGGPVGLSEPFEEYFRTLRGDYDSVRQLHLYDQVGELKRIAGKATAAAAGRERVKSASGRLSNLVLLKKAIRRLLFNEGFESDQKEVGKSLQESQLSYWSFLRARRRTIQRKQQLRRYYERLALQAVHPRTTFVLCPLMTQPEKTTSPVGGVFVHQYLMVDLVASCLPEGWVLLVREHPSQFVRKFSRYGTAFRSEAYYDRLAAVPGVKLASLTLDIFDLIDRSRAVATISGNVGWEAVVRGRPALCFGKPWYTGCEGIFSVGSRHSIREALEKVRAGYEVDHQKVRLFGRTLDQVGFKGAIGGPRSLQAVGVSPEENATVHAQALGRLWEGRAGRDRQEEANDS